MTLKKALLRGLLGAPLGVFISTTIGIIYSIVYGQLLVIPPVSGGESQLNAYLIQYFVSMVVGFTFAFGSAIFQVDSWGLTKQTVLHFLLTSIVFLPCSILAKWVKPDLISALIYFLIFIAIYVMAWFSQYIGWKIRIKKLNQKLASK